MSATTADHDHPAAHRRTAPTTTPRLSTSTGRRRNQTEGHPAPPPMGDPPPSLPPSPARTERGDSDGGYSENGAAAPGSTTPDADLTGEEDGDSSHNDCDPGDDSPPVTPAPTRARRRQGGSTQRPTPRPLPTPPTADKERRAERLARRARRRDNGGGDPPATGDGPHHYTHVDHALALHDDDLPGPHVPILGHRGIQSATEAIDNNPEIRELDLHAHDGLWYIGHPQDGQTLASGASEALDGLPAPRKDAVGPLEPLLPPLPPELALWAQRLHQHHDEAADQTQELYIRSGMLVGPGPRGGPLAYDGMEAMPHPAGYAGPLHTRSTSNAETAATDQRQGGTEDDEDDLDDAAAHDLPGDHSPPKDPPAAAGHQPTNGAEGGARRQLEGLPSFEVRQKPRAANSSAAETIYCTLWPCMGHGRGTFESFATRGNLKTHYMTHHVSLTKTRPHPGHSPLIPAAALDEHGTLQCERCHKCYASQRPMATHRAKGDCTLELRALRRKHGAADAAEERTDAQAADAAAAAGDELDPDNDPARPTATMAAALRADPVAANRTFLTTIKPAGPELHQVHSSALPAIPAAALTAWNSLHDTTIHTITRRPGKDEGYSLLLAAPRLILSPMPGTDPRCNLPGRIKTRILRLRAGEAEALWRLYPWDKMHKVPDRIHATRTGDLTVNAYVGVDRGPRDSGDPSWRPSTAGTRSTKSLRTTPSTTPTWTASAQGGDGVRRCGPTSRKCSPACRCQTPTPTKTAA